MQVSTSLSASASSFDIPWSTRWLVWATQMGHSDLSEKLIRFQTAFSLVGQGSLQNQQNQRQIVDTIIAEVQSWFVARSIMPMEATPAIPPPQQAQPQGRGEKFSLNIGGSVNASTLIMGDSINYNNVEQGFMPPGFNEAFRNDRSRREEVLYQPQSSPVVSASTNSGFPWSNVNEKKSDTGGQMANVVATRVGLTGSRASNVVAKKASLTGARITNAYIEESATIQGCQITNLYTIRSVTRIDPQSSKISNEYELDHAEWVRQARQVAGV